MNPQFTITNEITQDLARIERARGFLEAAQLSEQWVRRMSDRALLLEAHHSTHIEGTRLTLDESERLLAGQAVLNADADDVRELLNYREAFNLVSDYLESDAPITEGLVREVHKRLVANVRGDRARPGEYRTVQNYVANSITGDIIYTPPPPGDVPDLMHELVQWINQQNDVHPVLTAGIAQFQLVHIHPFIDGNGRTSRLLSTLVLYRAGYDFKRLFTISEYYDRDRSAFYAALQSVREADLDLTGWLTYFVAGLATQLDEVTVRGKQAMQIDVWVQEYGLNQRQTITLQHIIQDGFLSSQDMQALFPDISIRTLQRDLKVLLKADLIVAEGSTNRLIYRLKNAS
ncbi:MAG: Fic family protein [Caldilineaceae bacterium]|nr:Fic family protein [Caldilineaceae bacterium]